MTTKQRLDAIAAAIRELDAINAAKREDVERVKRECWLTVMPQVPTLAR